MFVISSHCKGYNQRCCTYHCRPNAGNGTATPTQSAESTPKVIVKIDNHTDPFATVVSVEFGNYLGQLLDTVSFCQGLISLHFLQLGFRSSSHCWRVCCCETEGGRSRLHCQVFRVLDIEDVSAPLVTIADDGA